MLKSIENAIYDRVKDNVRLKNGLKWVYQWLFSGLSSSSIETDLSLSERPQAFFGFHDKSPWSKDGTLLLGHEAPGDGAGEAWRDGRPIDILLFEGERWTESTRVARTRAWNWQQGAQLQWMGPGRKIVFNDFRDGASVGVICDLDAGRERVLSYPVAAVSPDGRRYASVCFETFGRAMDGYGYAFKATGATSPVEPATLVLREREGGETHITLADLATGFEPSQNPDEIDFFSHCLFSPEGDRLLFLRRQSRPNRRLRSELFSLDVEENAIQKIAFEDMVSHFTWLGPEKILAYANTRDGGDGFYVADASSGQVAPWSPNLNDRDGHPHAIPNGERVVFDTYPDRMRHQHLYLWDEGEERPHEIASLYSPMKFWGESRVDLHPRIRSDGEFISFDAGYSGTRSLVTARLPPSRETKKGE
jgi:hypothetical protein